jgi:transposase-like protein
MQWRVAALSANMGETLTPPEFIVEEGGESVGEMSEFNAAIVIPEVEVAEKAVRRQFSAEYKRKILKEADACTQEGEIGALLRREGLYSSHLAVWRAARDRGEIAGLAPKKRGPKAVPPDPRDRKIVELERETRRLKSRLERAEALVDLQKKVSAILGIALPESDEKP